MTSRRRIPTDMAGVKKSRAALTGSVTRATDKLQNMPSSEPEEVAILSLPSIQQTIDSLLRTEAGFNLSLDDAQKYLPGEEEEEAFLEAEDLAEEHFITAISKARHLAKALITLKQIHHGLDDFRRESKNIQDKIADNPGKLHDNIARLTSKFDDMNLQWKTADLGTTHPLRHEINACLDIILELKLAATAPESASTTKPTIISTETSDRIYYSSKNDLPAITVPHFDGTILGWSTFWASFKATIDIRKDLTNTQKLHYLRQAITDPDISYLLHSPTETEDMYLEVVKELKKRFDKPKEIHREVIKSILQLQTPKMTRVDLRRLSDSVKRQIDSLKSIKHYEIEPFLTSFIYNLLPQKLQLLWDQHVKRDRDVPPISRMLTFLRDHAESLADTQPPSSSSNKHPDPVRKTFKQQQQKQASSSYKTGIHLATPHPSYKWDCLLCQGEKHPLYVCPTWNSHSISQRLGIAKDRGLCNNCLIPGHATTDCRNRYRCRECGQPHHTTLHQSEEKATPVTTTLSHANNHPIGLMPTATVLLRGPQIKEIQVRALIDCGAGASLISNHIIKQLNLPKTASKREFTGIQEAPCATSHYSTDITISPIFNRNIKLPCKPSIVERVVAVLPPAPIAPLYDLPHLVGLRLADEKCHIPGRLDLLLGSEMTSLILTNSKPRIGPPDQPTAINTTFGWILSGATTYNSAPKATPSHHFQPAPPPTAKTTTLLGEDGQPPMIPSNIMTAYQQAGGAETGMDLPKWQEFCESDLDFNVGSPIPVPEEYRHYTPLYFLTTSHLLPTQPASGKLLPDAELPTDAPDDSATQSSNTPSIAENHSSPLHSKQTTAQEDNLKTTLSQLLPDAELTHDANLQTDLVVKSSTYNTTATRIPDSINLLCSTPAAGEQLVKIPTHQLPSLNTATEDFAGGHQRHYHPSREVCSMATEDLSPLSPDSASLLDVAGDQHTDYNPGRDGARPPGTSYPLVRPPVSSQPAAMIMDLGDSSGIYRPSKDDCFREEETDLLVGPGPSLSLCLEPLVKCTDSGIYDPRSQTPTLHWQDDLHQPPEDNSSQLTLNNNTQQLQLTPERNLRQYPGRNVYPLLITQQIPGPQTDGSPNHTANKTSNSQWPNLLTTLLTINILLIISGLTLSLCWTSAAPYQFSTNSKCYSNTSLSSTSNTLLTRTILTYHDYASTQKSHLHHSLWTLTSSAYGVTNYQWITHLTPQMLTNKHFTPINRCLLTTSHLRTPSIRPYPDVRSKYLQLHLHSRTYNVLPPAVCSDINCLPSASTVASHFKDYSYQISTSTDLHSCRTTILAAIDTLDFIP